MSEHNDDFVSFEKALRDLKLQSEELKKLVSEGEIRAFRDGQSMKFKREDLETLSRGSDSEELMFAESLEDDTGMVTEELTDEETLLAEDDLLEDDAEPAPSRSRRSSSSSANTSRRARPEPEPETAEPMWVTIAAGVGAALMVYGLLVVYAIAAEAPPEGLTGFFAK